MVMDAKNNWYNYVCGEESKRNPLLLYLYNKRGNVHENVNLLT